MEAVLSNYPRDDGFTQRIRVQRQVILGQPFGGAIPRTVLMIKSMRRFFGAVLDLLEEERKEREENLADEVRDEAEGGLAPASAAPAVGAVPADAGPLALAELVF